MLPFEIEKNYESIRAEVEKLGAELVEITFRRMGARHVLTVTADKEGGITLDDCASINRRLGDFLDQAAEGLAEPLLQGSYDLEVVSPGLDRPLKTEKDFSRAIGEIVRMTFKKEADGIATWTGKVLGANSAGIELQLKDGAKKLIALNQIINAHREIGASAFGGKEKGKRI